MMKSRLYEILEEYLSEEQLIVLNLDEYAEQFHFLKPVMMSSIPQDTFMRYTEHASYLGVMFDEYEVSNMYQYDVSNRHRQTYNQEVSCS